MQLSDVRYWAGNASFYLSAATGEACRWKDRVVRALGVEDSLQKAVTATRQLGWSGAASLAVRVCLPVYIGAMYVKRFYKPVAACAQNFMALRRLERESSRLTELQYTGDYEDIQSRMYDARRCRRRAVDRKGTLDAHRFSVRSFLPGMIFGCFLISAGYQTSGQVFLGGRVLFFLVELGAKQCSSLMAKKADALQKQFYSLSSNSQAFSQVRQPVRVGVGVHT